MRIRQLLTDAFRNPTDNEVLYECRRCGTTIDDESEVCPHCGAGSVARYEIR